jgi:hypothetical protein
MRGRSGSEREASRERAGALLASALLGLGCAGTPELVLPPVHAVLVAPLGLDQARHAVEPGAEVLDELISRVLWERDLRVHAPPADELREDWEQARRASAPAPGRGAPADDEAVDAAAGALVASWRARGTEFDVLLIPYLRKRQGVVVGQSVQWDGAVRRLPLEYEYREKVHVESRRGLEVPCTSLRVLAFGSDGRRLFELYGGLEVTLRMKLAEGRMSWTERGDLFRNREDLEDGVRIALRPLLED